jgi:hypothetical protein
MLPNDVSDINKTIEDFQHELDNSNSIEMTPVPNHRGRQNPNEDIHNKSQSEHTVANNMSTSMMFINDEPNESVNQGANNSAFAMRPKRRKNTQHDGQN